MFERFSDGARQTIVLAQEEARRLQHNYIGTEHLLAGLLRGQDGVAADVLGEMGVELERVRRQIVRLVGRGEEATVGQIPFTPRFKLALEHSLGAAQSLGHDHIGPEHLLLGLIREGGCVAVRVLIDLRVYPEELRDRLLNDLADPGSTAHKRHRLSIIEAHLSAFENRGRVAEAVGEADHEEAAVSALERLLAFQSDQAEQVLRRRIGQWTRSEIARLEDERDRLRAELGGD